MKRKVNLVGQNTLTISLPTNWVKERNIQKGDELELIEDNTNLLISSSGKDPKNRKTELNITGLDRTSIMILLRGAYRAGSDEIILRFDQPHTTHHRREQKVSILSVIHQETNRLIGVSIIKETEDLCIIKDFSANLEQEFEPTLRRIFQMLNDMASDFLKAIEKKDDLLMSTLEEKHDTLTKFISYCLRMISKGAIQKNDVDSHMIYHILACIDSIVDIYKYAARDYYPAFKTKITKNVLPLVKQVNEGFNTYYALYYGFSNDKCDHFIKTRDEFKRFLVKNVKKLSEEELILLTYMEHIFEILWDLVLARTSIGIIK